MKKPWSIILGIVMFGLAPLGIKQVTAEQNKQNTNAKSNVAPVIFLFIVIALIFMFTFSMEIKSSLS